MVGSDFLFWIDFRIVFLAVGFCCLVLTSIGSSIVVCVVVGVDGPLFHFLYGQFGHLVNACVHGMGDGFLFYASVGLARRITRE